MKGIWVKYDTKCILANHVELKESVGQQWIFLIRNSSNEKELQIKMVGRKEEFMFNFDEIIKAIRDGQSFIEIY